MLILSELLQLSPSMHSATPAELNALEQAKNHLHLFGYVTLKNLFTPEELLGLDKAMDSSVGSKPDIRADTIESLAFTQPLFFTPKIARILNGLLDAFWYWGTDSVHRWHNFPMHRDSFVRVPNYKLFVPYAPVHTELPISRFLVLPGSHYAFDHYSIHAARAFTDWEQQQTLRHSSAFNASSLDQCSAPCSETGDNLIGTQLHLGDAFLFNTNLVHGLIADESQSCLNNFIAFSVVPAPSTHKRYGFSRSEHEINLINLRIAILGTHLYRHPLTKYGYLFNPESIKQLSSISGWREAFGYANYNETIFERYAQSYGHLAHSIVYGSFCDFKPFL
jgi:hypothetical protein